MATRDVSEELLNLLARDAAIWLDGKINLIEKNEAWALLSTHRYMTATITDICNDYAFFSKTYARNQLLDFNKIAGIDRAERMNSGQIDRWMQEHSIKEILTGVKDEFHYPEISQVSINPEGKYSDGKGEYVQHHKIFNMCYAKVKEHMNQQVTLLRLMDGSSEIDAVHMHEPGNMGQVGEVFPAFVFGYVLPEKRLVPRMFYGEDRLDHQRTRMFVAERFSLNMYNDSPFQQNYLTTGKDIITIFPDIGLA